VEKPNIGFVRNDSGRHDFEDWLLGAGGTIAVDTETTGLDVWHDRVRVVQFGDEYNGFAIPVEGPTQRFGENVVRWAMWLMNGNKKELVAHRMKFDIQFLRNAGFNTAAIRQDSKASSHLLNPATSGLKEAAAERFGGWVLEGEAAKNEAFKKARVNWETVPIDNYEYLYYAALDPCLAAAVHDNNAGTIATHYQDLYEMECEVALALVEAEQVGLHVDTDYCWEQLEVLETEIIELEEEYGELNLGSVQQVASVLTDAGYKLPRTAPSTRFPKGQPQVTEEVLEDISFKNPGASGQFARDALQYRRLGRNAGTYFGSYLDLQIDGKIHTFIDTLGARNGRMSSRTPNLQNVPKRREGDYVRRAFYAPEGFKIVSADYAQIEYRIFAAAAREPDMVQAILDGKDLHAVTAQIVYDDPDIDEDDPRRDNAKNGNFAEIYMAGIPKFAKTAGISVAEATTFRTKYHQKFKQVKPFTQEVMKYAQANGLAVESKFGRRIPVDYDRVYAAVNYLISSTAADVLKRGIRKISRTPWIEYYRLPIHDENIFVVPDELVSQAVKEIPELMEDRETFSVPIEADVKVMQRWGSKEAA